MSTQIFRVEAIALHEVGVFDDTAIEFKPIESPIEDAKKAEIHLLTGPNGCGKSTVLYAIAEIFNAHHLYSPIRRRFRNDQSSVDFQFSGQAGRYSTHHVPLIGGTLSNRYGPYTQLHRDPYKGEFFGYGEGRRSSELDTYKSTTAKFDTTNVHSQLKYSFVAFAYSGQRTLTDTKISAIQPITESPFAASLSFDGSVRPHLLLQWIANNRAQSALAKADSDLNAAESFDKALRRITNLVKDICDLDITFRLERSPLAVTTCINGESIHFDALPDGLKSIISWIGDLSMRLEAIPWQESLDIFEQNVILLLDEVDIHLHPKWQRRVLPAIQRLLPNSQVFVSTHSPFVVGSVEDAWVYRLPERGTTNSEIIEAVPAGAGKSYRLILEEVFGIEGEFDVETERLFTHFYELREDFLKQPSTPSELLTAARSLANRGDEAKLIIGRELRQLSRITGQEITLA